MGWQALVQVGAGRGKDRDRRGDLWEVPRPISRDEHGRSGDTGGVGDRPVDKIRMGLEQTTKGGYVTALDGRRHRHGQRVVGWKDSYGQSV